MAEVADELNVKALESVADLEGLLDETVVPNFRRLGPKVGPLMPALKAALAALDGATVRRSLETDGVYRVELGTETVTLEPDDVEVHASAHEEFALARDGACAVALDTAIDDDLRLEGLARELVRALNDLRKARDLELSDRISVGLHTTGALAEAARRHGDWIQGEVLAREWSVSDVADGGEWDADAGDAAFSAIEIDGVPAGVWLAVLEGR
jgi:isoleucyl-tRNA synthetase